MNKEIKIGCDYCGQPKPVRRAKKKLAGSKQWQQLFLCNECIKIKL